MTDLLAKVQANAHRLDVYVDGNRVGTLERHGAAGSVFAYLPDAGKSDFTSLLMPVRLESYAVPSALIPTFQQNLPEGFLRRKITERFGKVLATDDFVLLALTGANPIGRQRVVPSGFARNWAEPLQVDIDALMADRHPEFKAIGAGMARQWTAGIKLLSYFDASPRRALSAP
ncbi:HipA N-terminal domain-containing protein [Variovorax paradoxus]|nr:HipA N-terminal domain-containing protein [Variovorax paradoxus]